MNVSQTSAAQPSILRFLTHAVTFTAKDHDGVDCHEKNTNIFLFETFRLISTVVYREKRLIEVGLIVM